MNSIQETHWFSFGECSVAVEEKGPSHGSRGILFFIHGRFGTGACWGPLLEQLKDDYRCFVIHLPGCGGMSRSVAIQHHPLTLLDCVELVMQVLKYFVPEGFRAILVGHDSGGVIVQLCGARLDPRVEGLVLINSANLISDSRLKIYCLGWGARMRFYRLLQACVWKGDQESDARRLLEEPWESRADRIALLEAIREIQGSWPRAQERRFWMEEIRKIHFPILMLWGVRDEFNSPQEAIKLWKLLPIADFFETHAGHWPHLEDPEWVAIKIREYQFRLSLKYPVNRAQRSP